MKLNKALTWITSVHLLLDYLIYYYVVHYYPTTISKTQLPSEGNPYEAIYMFGIPLILVWFIVTVIVVCLSIIKFKDWFYNGKIWSTIPLMLVCLLSPIAFCLAFLIALQMPN